MKILFITPQIASVYMCESYTMELIAKALEDRLGVHVISDVPVAPFISNGIDSGAFAVLTSGHIPC